MLPLHPILDFACAVIIGVILLAALKLSVDTIKNADAPEPPTTVDMHKTCAFYPVETKMTLRRRQRKLGRTVGNKRRK
jgi:hypothetical protein